MCILLLKSVIFELRRAHGPFELFYRRILYHRASLQKDFLPEGASTEGFFTKTFLQKDSLPESLSTKRMFTRVFLYKRILYQRPLYRRILFQRASLQKDSLSLQAFPHRLRGILHGALSNICIAPGLPRRHIRRCG